MVCDLTFSVSAKMYFLPLLTILITMATIQDLITFGRELDYEGDELKQFVSTEQASQREEREKERREKRERKK